MDLKHLLLVAALVRSLFLAQSKGQCPPIMEVTYIYGWALFDHLVWRHTTTTEEMCFALCIKEPNCRSLNYDTTGSLYGNCELSSTTKKRFPDSFKPRTSWIYYENKRAGNPPNANRTQTPGKMKLYQQLPTTGAGSVTSFTINNELFVAYSSYYNDKSYQTHSQIYKLQQNTFVLNQTIKTLASFSVEHFSINNDVFLAFASLHNSLATSGSVYSSIYKLVDGVFHEYQRVPTTGATDIHFFTVGDKKFLAISCHAAASFIYRWEVNKFVKHQEIHAAWPIKCTTFTIENSTYIAFSSYLNNGANSLFKWSGWQFIHIQSFESRFSRMIHPFKVNGVTFLAIANHASTGTENLSPIYHWDGSKFVIGESVVTVGAYAFRSFAVGRDTYLGVANYFGKSKLYKIQKSHLILHQELEVHWATDLIPIFHDGRIYLAFANHYNSTSSSFNTASLVFLWS